MRVVTALMMCAWLWGCGGGQAVRVDCDGPLELINPPAGPSDNARSATGKRSPAQQTVDRATRRSR